MDDLVALKYLVTKVSASIVCVEEIDPLPKWHLPKLYISEMYKLSHFFLHAKTRSYFLE